MAAMKREDFICTIGYQGDTAIVDGGARRRYGKRSARELLDEGLYRQAYCAALWDDGLEDFLPAFCEKTGVDVASVAALKRLFGVFEVPESGVKVSVIS